MLVSHRCHQMLIVCHGWFPRLHEVLHPFEEEVNHWGDVECEELGDEESSNDGDAERASGVGTGADAEGDGERAHDGGHGGHHDGAEADEARFEDGFFCALALDALCLQCEINHHDGVLFHDADEEQDADEAIHVDLVAVEFESEQCSEAG